VASQPPFSYYLTTWFTCPKEDGMNLGSIFSRHARFRADHTALAFEDRRWTHREFNQQINRAAHAMLSLGIKKGAKVATILPNCPELLEMYWASAKIGAVVVPMSTLLMESALKTLLNDSDTELVVTIAAFAKRMDALRPALPKIPADRFLLIDGEPQRGFQDYHALKAAAADTEPQGIMVSGEDLFDIVYSSGTTGMPKGILHTHDIRIAYGTSFATAYRMTPECVTMHAGAIVFNGAFVDLMPTVFQGGTYVLMPQFDPVRYIEAVARERVTHVMLVPAQVVALMNAPNFDPVTLSSLEMILVLGAPFHAEHKEMLNAVLPGRFYELYGLTEGVITVLDKTDYAKKPQSVGASLPLFEMKIVDDTDNEVPPGVVGEICGRGPLLTPGYYGRPDLTEKAIVDGWMHTGDLGYVDEDGYLYLVDRMKDMIISGGVNVYPRDIEEIVVQHPAVKEAAVFGVPDEKWGETPLASVILMDAGTVDEVSLMEWINARVGAKFQRVSGVRIMDDFPRSTAGKTLKRELRAPFWKAQKRNL
jgi:acyl-CoA synthetase (AMP-forming)/AMP-acid ligase II